MAGGAVREVGYGEEGRAGLGSTARLSGSHYGAIDPYSCAETGLYAYRCRYTAQLKLGCSHIFA